MAIHAISTINNLTKQYGLKGLLRAIYNKLRGRDLLCGLPFPAKIRISLIVPLHNPSEKNLQTLIQSVLHQSYAEWELCLCNVGSMNENLRTICKKCSRKNLRIKYYEVDAGIEGASEVANACLRLSTGDYVAFLDQDGRLSGNALNEIIRAVTECHPDILYSDEELISPDGVRSSASFKPNWSPDLLYSYMYIGNLLVVRRNLIVVAGGFRKGYDECKEYDLMLRLSELTDSIYHIPLILYSSSRCKIGGTDVSEKTRQALEEHLKKEYGATAHAELAKNGQFLDARFPRVTNKLVSIIIPMKDKYEMTENCIRSILEKTTYKEYEILILDNRSQESETISWLGEVEKLDHRIRVEKADVEFNWSKINNYGAQIAKGDIFVFLNNDTLVISPDWLDRLCENVIRKDIGTVGALLKYEDNTIQHAGVVVGIGGWADHVFKGMEVENSGMPFVSPMASRNVTAVTGACVAIEKKKFELLGKFDETFIICGSDVELGIRANKMGLFNRYDANVALYHLESKSRSTFVPEQDYVRSYECYTSCREWGDPFYNLNLDINSVKPRDNRKKNRYSIRPIYAQNQHVKKSFPVLTSQTNKTLSNPYRIPEIEPMYARVGNARKKVRLNLLVPSVDKTQVFGGISTAISFFEKMCDGTDCEKRVILTDGPYNAANSVLSSEYEFVEADRDADVPNQVVPFSSRRGKTFPVAEKDIFVATAWWTAYNIADVIRWQRKVFSGFNTPLIYLIQDYEPGFYPWSTRYMLADSTYRMEIPVYAVFNSRVLKEFFDINHYHFEQQSFFDPILSKKLLAYLPEEKQPIPKKRQILIYGRPNVARNSFEQIVMGLQKWAEIYDKCDEWNIVVAGEDFKPFSLTPNISLKSVGKLSMDGYAKALLESYAGISLMVSPHPSYPPLEMSTFGIKTITNSYANKNLEKFNSNIISLNPCSPKTIADALVEICNGYTGEAYAVIGNDYTNSSGDGLSAVAHDVSAKCIALSE